MLLATIHELSHGEISMLLFLAIYIAVVAATARNQCPSDAVGCSNDQCQLYLAPSTIKNAGLGVFTAKSLEKGESVGIGGVVVPVVDVQWHVGKSEDFFWHFREYVWQGWDMGMRWESEDEHLEAVTAFVPGIDAATNCNSALVNAKKTAQPVYDTAGLHRSHDPGAGSFTPYHNGTTTATAPIPAGGEVFKYYGDEWFVGRFGMEHIPYEQHFNHASNVVDTFASLNLSRAAMRSLWNVVKIDPWESRQAYAFPKTAEDALEGARDGIRSLHQPSAIRSIDFLVEQGRCMDVIQPGLSTINGAGRGAFATRFHPQGSIITCSPLLHIPERDYLLMYGVEEGDETRLKRNASDIIGIQLLLNYCFGHEESSLLLCPYGNDGVGFINHNASLANVKIQFAPDGIIGQKNRWLEEDVANMDWDYNVGVAFDYVATRDILPGEELVLNYGDAWENAWHIHIQNWKPVNESDQYVSAHDWNEQSRGTPLRSVEEQQVDPYPENVRLICHSNITNELDGVVFEWHDPDEWGVECNVIARTKHDESFVYEVKVDGDTIENVPRDAFRFTDVPYSTDMHLPNAFRHEMMIPDSMFPEKWRNKKR